METMNVSQLAQAMQTNLHTLLEVFVSNAPGSTYAYLRRAGANLPFTPDKSRLFGAIAQMIKRHDVEGIAKMLKSVPFNPQPTGSALSVMSANPHLWATLNVTPQNGCFYEVFEKYFVEPKGGANGAV